MGSNASFSDLVELIVRLRDPVAGCPWDRAQDHASLRPYLIEEAYEAISAIDGGDPDALACELGDVLLQVLLHSQIASEQGQFSIDDVIDGLADKLTRRHPHVFGDAPCDLASVHRRWEEVKAAENHVPGTLPILVRARKTISALAREGRSELIVEEALGCSPEACAGAKLLCVIDEIWREGLDPELALRKALDRLSEKADT